MVAAKKALGAVLLCLALIPAATAGEVAGVKMPDTITMDGKILRLNGMGLRKKLIFNVYVAGLYLESPSKEAATILSTDQIRSIQLHVLRSLSPAQLAESISEGFWKNSKSQRSLFESRLETLTKMFPKVTEGDLITLTYVPGKGTIVVARGEQKGVIVGKDFADTLFAIWLGSNPVQNDLKKALLGS